MMPIRQLIADRTEAIHRTRVGGSVAFFIALLAFATFALWLLDPPWRFSLWMGNEWPSFAALVLITCVAQLTPIDIYGAGKVSGAAILILVGGFAFGIPGALLLATEVALVQLVIGRGEFHRFLFDLSALSLSAAAAAWLASFASGFIPHGVPVWVVVPLVVAGFAFYVVNIGLLSSVMSLSERRSLLELWDERFRWLWVHYLVYGLFAGLILVAYSAIGIWGFVVFYVPTLMLRYVMKQYVDRTEQNVRRLTDANLELQVAHDQVFDALARLKETYDETLVALSAALDTRDSETEGHSQRVVAYSTAIAERLGLSRPEMESLVAGALLHDLGKIGVPDAILRKPSPLDAAEWEIMQSHTELGYSMLAQIAFLKDALPLVRCHHERFDGAGYPRGLAGTEIPLLARVFAVADTFDAMTSSRPYRTGCSCEVALEEIRRCSGSQFDPDVVRALCEIDLETLRRLSGQEIHARASGSRLLGGFFHTKAQSGGE